MLTSVVSVQSCYICISTRTPGNIIPWYSIYNYSSSYYIFSVYHVHVLFQHTHTHTASVCLTKPKKVLVILQSMSVLISSFIFINITPPSPHYSHTQKCKLFAAVERSPGEAGPLCT